MAAKSTPAPEFTFARGALLAVAILAFLAAGISAYLLVQKLTGQISSLVGCGQKSGCANILGGRWSVWFNLPISIGGLLTYALLFAMAISERQQPHPRGKTALWALALVALVAALWFTILQIALKSFCPYCSSIHLCGLLIFALVAWQLARARGCGADFSFVRLGMILAAVGSAVMFFGQAISKTPPTFEVAGASAVVPAQSKTPVAEPSGGRVLQVLGQLPFDSGRWPISGSPSAKHVLVEFFDYTCNNCARLHTMLTELKPTLKDVAILYVPMPLNRQCTPNLKPGVNDHANACEYARCALAVWECDRGKFLVYHDYLFTYRESLTPAQAQQKAGELVGQSRFAEAMISPWVNEALQQSAPRYERLTGKSIAMPKLWLGGEAVMAGTPETAAQLLETLRQYLKL